MQYENFQLLRLYCCAIGMAVFVLNFVILIAPAFAQQTNITPKISCHVMQVESTAEGIFTVGNLDRIRLKVEVDGGEWPIEELKISGVHVPSDDQREPNVKITIDSLSDTKQDVPVRISPFGGGGKYNTHTISTVLEIPISEEEKRGQFDQFLLKVLDSLDPNDPIVPNDPNSPKKAERIESGKEFTYLYLRKLHFEHKPGLYQITCSYRSFKPSFWNGEINSDPILVRIVFENSFYDRSTFLPK